MQKITCLLAIALLSFNVQAQKFMTKTGTISFNASGPLEKIEGINKSSACLLDTKSGGLDFVVQIKSFVFEKQLMQEHFNENYMESDQFPKATFKGTLTNLTSINFAKDGEYTAEVSGKLTIHGVAKDIRTTGKITVKDGKPTIKANFTVLLSEYKIDIPGAVKDKISKDAKILINASLDPLKS